MARSGIAASILTVISITAGTWSIFSMISPTISQAGTPNSLLLAESPSADLLLAQFPPSSTTVVNNQRSITVTGTGQAKVPADQAMLQMYFYTIAPVEYDASKPPEPVRVSDYQFIERTLTDLGVPAGDIDLYVDPANPSSLRLQITLNQPTADRMNEMVTAINNAVSRDARLSSSGVSVAYSIDDCVAPENEARRQAMADARSRVAAFAEVAEVKVGKVLSLSEYPSWGMSYTSTCPSTANLSASAVQFGGYSFDPTLPPEVSITTQVTASYAIED
ncbi:MAG TPA: SIMPL domain-containing protein [Allocoleopsis sp.]